MSKDDRIRLRHMLDAAREALEFSAGRTRADLDRDRMLVLSLVKSIEILGEAAGKVSQEVQDRHPEIPWADMVGMRNRLIHAYHDVNPEVVWRTIQHDLPPLVKQLESALSPSDHQA